MKNGSRNVVIVSGARTPIGSFMGALQTVSAPKLGAACIKEALSRAKVDPKDVSEVFMGCVLTAGVGQAPARQASIFAGIPNTVSCTTINKVCGSGLQSIVLGAQGIALGHSDIVVCGGMENMSQAPHLLRGHRTGQKMGNVTMVDSMVKDGLWDVYGDEHMGNCAELCAKDKNISRQSQDAFAIESYRRAVHAQQQGAFTKEIVPVTVSSKKGDILVTEDEEPGRGKPDKIPKLRSAFQKDGTVTAGNASSLNDGAACVVLMAEEEAKRRNIIPLAKIVAFGNAAHAPEWFTTAPAKAVHHACESGWMGGAGCRPVGN